jgi:NAD(P)-dependent dehydrogenase (short-subunit alcohol dehydrogenase family)
MLKVNLRGRVAIITGGASGIGLATAEGLRDCGATVISWDVQSTSTQCPSNSAESAVVDLSSPEQIAAAAHNVIRRYGRVDMLVNSAGIVRRAAAVDCSLSDWSATLDVNVTGAFIASRELVRQMPAGSAIVNIASIMGFTGGLFPNAAYQTSKGAVVNMTRALAVEWAPLGVRVNAVAPTFTETPFVTNLREDTEKMAAIMARTPLRRLAAATDIADSVIFLLSAHAGMITGHTLPVDGGYLAQ